MSDKFIEYRKKTSPREQLLELKKLRKNDGIDYLTGLPNRKRLMNDLSVVFAEFNREGRFFAGVFIDIDNFKAVNDTIGHGEGDTLLTRISTILKNSIRETDSVYRIGGDEMFILLRNVDPDFGIEVGQKIVEGARTVLRHQLRSDTREAYEKVGLSCGIATPIINEKIEDFMHRADQAMYIDKGDKNNRLKLMIE
jgi:diguanylate cyclase (GGDEF)-like protein